MPRRFRPNSQGVASTVSTLFGLVLILAFLQVTVFGAIPARQYEAEWAASMDAIDSFQRFRRAGQLASFPDAEFTVTFPISAPSVSPLSAPAEGRIGFSPAGGSTMSVSFTFVPKLSAASVAKVDQDVILLMDSSGSMVWNDPLRLRISSAKEYLGQLTLPDRVAIVDFDGDAQFTRANVGGPVHHLYTDGHAGPDYSEAQSDLDTIDQSGSTNFGDAIRIANDEFIANGDRSHAWVMILLTDGRNTVPGADAMARAEAQEAKALGITIYTIGLGDDLNEALLREIADTTGGTYYHAQTAEEIRWIYFEISRRYAGDFRCGSLTTMESSYGALELDLANHEYPAQTVRFDVGAIEVDQEDGALLREGPMLQVSEAGGGSEMSLTLFSLIGEPQVASGVGVKMVHGRVLGADRVDQTIVRVALDQTSLQIRSDRETFDYWADQGAATPGAKAAVDTPMRDAEQLATWAHENMTSGDIANAKFNVDRAQGQLGVTIAALLDGEARGEIQSWLADATRDSVLLDACRLDQWRNWYEGITIQVTSAFPEAWTRWLQSRFADVSLGVTWGASGNDVVMSFHAVNRLVMSTRTIEVTIL